MTIVATVNGQQLTRAVVTLTRWGIPRAEVSVDRGEPLTGQVTIELAGLRLVGTVVPGRGGVFHEQGSYTIDGGFGGWSKKIPPAAYQTPLTRLSTVLTDAARACGEKVLVDAAADRTVGPCVRLRGQASQLLELYAPEGWWVDLDGTTRVGARPATVAPIDPLDASPARGVATVALEDVSALLPGATVQVAGASREVGTVVHRLDAAALSTELWLQKGGDRFGTALRRIVQGVTAPLRYFGVYEVRVVSQTGDTWTVEPLEKDGALPPFPPVAARTSIPGLKVELGAGAHILVGFVNGNPGRPYVAGFPGTADPGALPMKVTIGDGDAPFVRVGDGIMMPSGSAATPTAVPIVLSKVPSVGAPDPVTVPGPPGIGFARLRG